MKIRVRLIDCTFLIILLFQIGCEAKKADLEEQINQLEAAIDRDNNSNFQQQALTENTTKLVSLYDQYIQNYPGSDIAAEYLYNAAMVSANNLQNYNRALNYLEQLRREYPNSQRQEEALFMMGYMYSNELGNYERAKVIYESFLEKYPESKLVSSVQFELEHLGKSQIDLDFLGE